MLPSSFCRNLAAWFGAGPVPLYSHSTYTLLPVLTVYNPYASFRANYAHTHTYTHYHIDIYIHFLYTLQTTPYSSFTLLTSRFFYANSVYIRF